MDSRLEARLRKLEAQILKMREAESVFHKLEAHSDVLFSQLFDKLKQGSIAEREAKVYASQDWIDFAAGLAQSKTDYNHERRMHELQLKAFDSEYITYKVEESAIRRQGA